MSQDQLFLPLELLTIEVRPKLDFYTLLAFAKTATELYKGWIKYVLELPDRIIGRCDTERLSLFTSLTALNIPTLSFPVTYNITTLSYLTSLKTLTIPRNTLQIKDTDLAGMVSLTTLSLGDVPISDQGISHLTNLTYLNFGHGMWNNTNGVITDNSIKELCSLRYLNLGYTDRICDSSISMLTALCTLLVGNNNGITNLEHLTSLVDLTLTSYTSHLWWQNPQNLQAPKIFLPTTLTSLTNCKHLSDDDIKQLTRLTTLNLGSADNTISDDAIISLTSLTYLDLGCNNTITDRGVEGLTNLTNLIIGSNRHVSIKYSYEAIVRGGKCLPYNFMGTVYNNVNTPRINNLRSSRYSTMNLAY
jgi:hypothetical protein